MICLGTGAVLDTALGRCQGRGSDEQSLLRTMPNTLKPRDILLGDAFYATYFLLCQLQQLGVDGVFEQQGSRKRSTDFRRGRRRLGQRDHLIELRKLKRKPGWMSQQEYELAPESLARRVGFSPYQNDARHGDAELPRARDGRKGDLGLSAGLQPDSHIDGTGCIVSRHSASPAQLQAHVAAMGRVEME
jgi:hypothetical protein